MEKFSQRMGFQPANTAIQIDSVNARLKNELWNVTRDCVFGYVPSYDLQEFYEQIWMSCFNKPLDEAPSSNGYKLFEAIKKHYFTLEWYEVYDFIEFIADNLKVEVGLTRFIEECNTVLKRELSAYRFIGKKLVPVTSAQETIEIERAVNISSQFTQHLERALTLLSDRKTPDYVNSMKESISAVEAVCKFLTGDRKATLGDALKKLESKGILLPKSLKQAFNSIYGYTSDSEGIRHGLVGKTTLDVEDARFMLTACSAFINYLQAKAEKAGIALSSNPQSDV